MLYKINEKLTYGRNKMKSTFKFNGQTINISSGNYVIEVDGNNLSINTVAEAQQPTDEYDIPDNILPFMRPTMEESLSNHLGMSNLPVLDMTKHGSSQPLVKQNFKKVGDKAIIMANNDKTIRGAFYSMGRVCSAPRINKKQKRGPFQYLVTETAVKNSYTKAASKPKP